MKKIINGGLMPGAPFRSHSTLAGYYDKTGGRMYAAHAALICGLLI
jgi:hypothetical protein